MSTLPKNTKQNNSIEQTFEEKQKNNDSEKQTGFGNKKLEGPNRPAE